MTLGRLLFWAAFIAALLLNALTSGIPFAIIAHLGAEHSRAERAVVLGLELHWLLLLLMATAAGLLKPILLKGATLAWSQSPLRALAAVLLWLLVCSLDVMLFIWAFAGKLDEPPERIVLLIAMWLILVAVASLTLAIVPWPETVEPAVPPSLRPPPSAALPTLDRQLLLLFQRLCEEPGAAASWNAVLTADGGLVVSQGRLSRGLGVPKTTIHRTLWDLHCVGKIRLSTEGGRTCIYPMTPDRSDLASATALRGQLYSS